MSKNYRSDIIIDSSLFRKRDELIDYLKQLPYHKQLRTSQWQELKDIEKVLSNDNTRIEFDFCAERGFNPNPNPQTSFLTYDPTIEILARDVKRIPKLLVTEQFRNYVDSYKPDRYEEVANLDIQIEGDVRLAMNLLSFMAHAYLWGGKEPATVLPAVIAVPWCAIAKKMGRPPIQSYASYALDNWYKIDSRKDITLDNIALIQNFLGGVDEEWFTMIHIVMEAQAGPAMLATYNALNAAKANEWPAVNNCLYTIANSLENVYNTFCRMQEKCDPYIYYNRVRPYIFGTLNNPDLPDGLIYEGVEEFEGKPQKFRGETDAQSSIIPALDGALGIVHEKDVLREYLMEMREYMPPKHRAFIEWCDANGNLRQHVEEHDLTHAYNSCIRWMEAFRTKHLEFAGTYIHKQSQTESGIGSGGSTIYGTGGTPFMKYLKKHRDETAEVMIEEIDPEDLLMPDLGDP